MPARIVLILLVVAGIVLLLRWLARVPPARLAGLLKKSALYGGIGLLVILAMTGRLPWLFALAAAAVPIVQRLLTVWRLGQMAKQLGGMAGGEAAAGGQRSTIQTRFLRMWLDHDSGAMGGTVLEGRFRGRTLDQLSLQDKLALLGECRTDPQSAAVLEAYLDRMHGETWRESDTGAERAANGAQAEGGKMTAEEAYQVLGLEPGASEAEIRDSHRRLMQKLHPDRGGSTYLAAKINQAKDLLLNR